MRQSFLVGFVVFTVSSGCRKLEGSSAVLKDGPAFKQWLVLEHLCHSEIPPDSSVCVCVSVSAMAANNDEFNNLICSLSLSLSVSPVLQV